LKVQWGKLLLNLNNAVNAISGLPLKLQLSQRAYRRPAALLIHEALDVLNAAGIRPAKVGRVTPKLIPPLLRLPDFLFARAAGAMLRIDPHARTSMSTDLQRGHLTEVDYLNGEVVRLAKTLGRCAPFNQRICELIHLAEETPRSEETPLDGDTLYQDLLASARSQVPSTGSGAELGS
jgi:2-dehydropantoate 2-reductase